MGPLAELLFARLRGASMPVLVDGDRVLPAASLWTAARALTGQLRSLGLDRGDRVVVPTNEPIAVAVAVVMATTSGLAAVLAPAGASDDDLLAAAAQTGARLALTASRRDAGRPGLAGTALAGLDDPATVQLLPGDDHPEAVVVLPGTVAGHQVWQPLEQDELDLAVQVRLDLLAGPRWRDEPQRRLDDGTLGNAAWTGKDGVVDLLCGLAAAHVITCPRPSGVLT